MLVTFVWSICQMALVYYYEDGLISFYTHDHKVKASIRPAWNVLIVFIFFDCMQGVSSVLVNGLRLLMIAKSA